MGNPARLKERLLREAVADNVYAIEGRPAIEARRRVRRHLVARGAFLIGVPAALFAVAVAGSELAAAWRAQAASRRADRPAIVVEATPRPPRDLGRSTVVLATAPLGLPIGRSVLPLAVQRVVLDPGHGGANRGTASRDGLVEKDLTLDIAQRLERLLAAAAYEVVLTRDGDQALSLADRGAIANRREGDIFVSIHVNWLDDPGARGVETFYLGPTDDPQLEEMAARENAGSGLRLADLKEAIERVYAGVRREESRALAEAVQRALLVSLRTLDPEVANRGVKTAPFGVLIHTQMPAILAEVGCLSNDEESGLLRDEGYRQYLAETLFQGIRAYSEELSRSSIRGS
jgi:N-acetylmuramoyl-L-alanine amidase